MNVDPAETPAEPRRPRLRWSAVWIVLVLGLVAVPGRWDPAEDPRPEELGSILLSVATEADVDAAVGSVVALGSAGLDDLFDVHASGAFVHGERGHTVTDLQRRVLRSAITAWDERIWVGRLERWVRDSGEPSAVLAALRLVSEVGESESLLPALRMVEVVGEDPVWRRAVDGGLERAVAAVLGRDRASWSVVSESWGELDEDVRSVVLAAAGERRGPEPQELFAFLLQNYSEAREVQLLELLEVPGPLEPPDDWLMRGVRMRLMGTDPEVLRAAVAALGRLGDEEAVPDLLELLDASDAATAAAAHLALQRITRLGLPLEPVRWYAWYEDELTWHETERDELVELLKSADPGQVSVAVEQLSARQLDRAGLARELSATLEHPSSQVRVRGCQGLQRLGSTEIVGDLLWSLDDPDAAVRSSAAVALRSLTGIHVEPTRAAWESALYDE